jgi:protein-serine/threonine kinase
MLTGLPPFYNTERDKLFKNIKSLNIEYPQYLSSNSISLFKSIFIRDPDKRLGSGKNSVSDIKSHPFFETVNWVLIDKRQIKSPFKPKIKNEAEPIYIDDEFKNMSPTDSNGGDSVSKDESHLFASKKMLKKNFHMIMNLIFRKT